MDNAEWAEKHLVVTYGARRKPWYNMCRTTTRQEFIRHMDTWLRDEFPRDYDVFYYDKRLKQMVQLGDNEEYYLAQIFDSMSFENQVVGVVSTQDNHTDLFISAKNSTIFPYLSSEAFEEQYQVHYDRVIAEQSNSTTIAVSISSENDALFDSDTEEDVQYVSPTTNIQFQLTDHIFMEHDVCPTPKRLTYMSNKGKRGKSKLQYLSGVKGPNDRNKQIRPIIRIPYSMIQLLKENHSLELIVACVRETFEKGMRMLWIDMNSEFQIKGCKRTSRGQNPLTIPLTLEVIKNGTYKLQVILTRIPGKINKERNGELFHSLEDAIVNQLHSAEYDPESSRLAFIIHDNGFPQKNTIGFSNYIQEPGKKKATVSTNST